jgi:hypothetical protein
MERSHWENLLAAWLGDGEHRRELLGVVRPEAGRKAKRETTETELEKILETARGDALARYDELAAANQLTWEGFRDFCRSHAGGSSPRAAPLRTPALPDLDPVAAAQREKIRAELSQLLDPLTFGDRDRWNLLSRVRRNLERRFGIRPNNAASILETIGADDLLPQAAANALQRASSFDPARSSFLNWFVAVGASTALDMGRQLDSFVGLPLGGVVGQQVMRLAEEQATGLESEEQSFDPESQVRLLARLGRELPRDRLQRLAVESVNARGVRRPSDEQLVAEVQRLRSLYRHARNDDTEEMKASNVRFLCASLRATARGLATDHPDAVTIRELADGVERLIRRPPGTVPLLVDLQTKLLDLRARSPSEPAVPEAASLFWRCCRELEALGAFAVCWRNAAQLSRQPTLPATHGLALDQLRTLLAAGDWGANVDGRAPPTQGTRERLRTDGYRARLTPGWEDADEEMRGPWQLLLLGLEYGENRKRGSEFVEQVVLLDWGWWGGAATRVEVGRQVDTFFRRTFLLDGAGAEQAASLDGGER